MKPLVIFAVIAALLVAPLQAGQCVRQRIVQRAFVQHAYVAPIYAAQQIAYEPVYYQVGSALREEAIATRAAELAIERFKAELQQQGGGNSPVGQPPDSAAQALNAKVQAILTNRCARCHSGADPKGGIDLTDIRKIDDLTAHKAELLARKGVMPPADLGGAPIPDDEAATLEEWVLQR